MSDHERIWLQPECCADPHEGRQWCEDPDPVDCEEGVPWTEYVRADLRATAEARIAKLQKERDAVDKARAWDAIAQKNARIAELEAALRVFVALDGGSWHSVRHASERREALAAARALLGDK